MVHGLQSTFTCLIFFEQFRNICKLSKLNNFVEKFRFLKHFISDIFVNPVPTQ